MLNNQLIFKLSQIGFALNSDICYTNRVNIGIYDHVEYVAQVKYGDKIFISTSETDVSLHEMVKILECREQILPRYQEFVTRYLHLNLGIDK
jgi:hypothetical protein